MRTLLASLFLVLVGCTGEITNEEIIKNKELCENAGLDYKIFINGWTNKPYAVYCIKMERGK